MYQRCAEEYTKSQTLIQGYGTFLALGLDGLGQFRVCVASDNTLRILGCSPEALFSCQSFSDLLASGRASFTRRLESLLTVVPAQSPSPLDVFQCSLFPVENRVQLFWCTAHKSGQQENLILCEFEPAQDDLDSHRAILPHLGPTKILNYYTSTEQWRRSTRRTSKPLHSLQYPLENTSPVSPVDLISAMHEIQSQLISTMSLDILFGTIVGTVSELTGFDRVMVYRFDECKCGAVVSEYLDPLVSEDLFIGLHFPSSDLPQWIRDLYQADRVQVLRHRTSRAASLRYRDTERIPELDMTRSYLRQVTPGKVQLFSDLDVSSAMNISLVVNGDLWGLITCHSYRSKVVGISPPMREILRNIGDCASSQIERLLYAERLEARMLLATGLSQKSPAAFITGSASSLLQIFTSEFGMLVMNAEARVVGKLESYHEALALVQYFQARGVTSVIASQKIIADFPDLKYAPGFSTIAGLLVIPLSSSGRDFLIVFRKEQLMEIHWAGNTQERFELVGGGNLEPSASFQRWVEHVIDTSREWTTWQMEIAGVLRTLYSTFMDFWLKKNENMERSRKRQLLIANSSHEVRTPLNHIINHLEVALDCDMDPAAQDHIETSLKASRSLIYVINDLLDLTKTENSAMLMHEEPLLLQRVMLEALGAFSVEAERKGLRISFNMDTICLPEIIIGDSQRLRQVVSNILSNSLESSSRGTISFDISSFKTPSIENSRLRIAIKDEGKGMSERQLDKIFRQFEDILDEDDSSHDGDIETLPLASIGLGLAVVARFVRSSGGQMRIETKACVGTKVSLELLLRTSSNVPLKEPLLIPPTDSGNEMSGVELQGIASPRFHSSKNSPEQWSPEAISSTQITPFSITCGSPPIAAESHPFHKSSPADKVRLRILVAEDNPLNAKVLKMQLERMGHDVTLVGDGQACFDKFKENSNHFDIILMDFQMPLLDGPASTKLIREFETAFKPLFSSLASNNCRIPIFAVSASLLEQKHTEYLNGGFDGWILKPINFRHLGTLMMGIWNEEERGSCVYKPGMWENGGWLQPK
ncbi:hypothetical protein N431DRAFT_549109 [Stipitochalara longipes BDJ]|nr:hypothetical protein N431DRAFT_549109 [Stipitochalara longipes BDJ]